MGIGIPGSRSGWGQDMRRQLHLEVTKSKISSAKGNSSSSFANGLPSTHQICGRACRGSEFKGCGGPLVGCGLPYRPCRTTYFLELNCRIDTDEA